MDIKELEIKYAELGAEIQRLKRQPVGVWEPKENEWYWRINSCGKPIITRHCDNLVKANHNVYKTEELAEKASVLQRRSNLIIQACLNFEPDFVPDWKNANQTKFCVFYAHESGKWFSGAAKMHEDCPAYVSSGVIVGKVLAYLNSQEKSDG